MMTTMMLRESFTGKHGSLWAAIFKDIRCYKIYATTSISKSFFSPSKCLSYEITQFIKAIKDLLKNQRELLIDFISLLPETYQAGVSAAIA